MNLKKKPVIFSYSMVNLGILKITFNWFYFYSNVIAPYCCGSIKSFPVISNLDSSVKLYLVNLIAADIIDNYSD
jgi:hypothetical protein